MRDLVFSWRWRFSRFSKLENIFSGTLDSLLRLRSRNLRWRRPEKENCPTYNNSFCDRSICCSFDMVEKVRFSSLPNLLFLNSIASKFTNPLKSPASREVNWFDVRWRVIRWFNSENAPLSTFEILLSAQLRWFKFRSELNVPFLIIDINEE